MAAASIALIFAASFVGGASGATPAGSNLVPLHIASSSDEVIASVLYARQTGMFQRAGLDVQVEKQNSGAAIAAAVTSGTYDIGTSSLISLFNARQRGIAFTLVAPGAAYDSRSPISQLLVAKDSPIRSAPDLDGKVVGIQSLVDLDTVATRAWVDQHGGDSKTIRFVEMPMSAKAAALDARRIDAAIIGQPYLSAALDGGKTRILAAALSSIGPRFSQSSWFATTEWVSTHRDIARKFAAVVERANAYTNAHHTEVAPLLAQFLHLASAELRGTLGTTLTPADVQPVIDVAVRYRLIDHALTARDLLGP